MGLTEELQTLQNLRERGMLTDQEFAEAKATILRKHQEPLPVPAPRPSKKPALRLSFVLVLDLPVFPGFRGLKYNHADT